jgi:hypothetical protein
VLPEPSLTPITSSQDASDDAVHESAPPEIEIATVCEAGALPSIV